MNKDFTKANLACITDLASSIQGEGNINYIARMALLAAMSNEKTLKCFIEANHDDMVIDIIEEFVNQGFQVRFQRRLQNTYEINLSWG